MAKKIEPQRPRVHALTVGICLALYGYVPGATQAGA